MSNTYDTKNVENVLVELNGSVSKQWKQCGIEKQEYSDGLVVIVNFSKKGFLIKEGIPLDENVSWQYFSSQNKTISYKKEEEEKKPLTLQENITSVIDLIKIVCDKIEETQEELEGSKELAHSVKEVVSNIKDSLNKDSNEETFEEDYDEEDYDEEDYDEEDYDEEDYDEEEQCSNKLFDRISHCEDKIDSIVGMLNSVLNFKK